jgi:hypothetical protein
LMVEIVGPTTAPVDSEHLDPTQISAFAPALCFVCSSAM